MTKLNLTPRQESSLRAIVDLWERVDGDRYLHVDTTGEDEVVVLSKGLYSRDESVRCSPDDLIRFHKLDIMDGSKWNEGVLTQLAFDLVANNFAVPDAPTSYSVTNHVAGQVQQSYGVHQAVTEPRSSTGELMPAYDLHDELRELLKRLVEAGGKAGSYTFKSGPLTFGTRPGVTFIGSGGEVSVECDRGDLLLMRNAGALDLTTFNSMHVAGQIPRAAVDSVEAQFPPPRPPAPPVSIVNNVQGQLMQAVGDYARQSMTVGGSQDATKLAAELARLTDTLAANIRAAFPAEVADPLISDVAAVRRELEKPQPNAAATGSRLGTVMSRLTEAVGDAGKMATSVDNVVKLAGDLSPLMLTAWQILFSHHG